MKPQLNRHFRHLQDFLCLPLSLPLGTSSFVGAIYASAPATPGYIWAGLFHPALRRARQRRERIAVHYIPPSGLGGSLHEHTQIDNTRNGTNKIQL